MSAKHINRVPFEGVLAILDQPSERSPSGARGHRLLLPASVAKAALTSLVGMAVNVSPDFMTHCVTSKVGIITRATVRKRALQISGYLFGFDFPDVVCSIKKRADLGMSFEIQDVHIQNMQADVWVVSRATFSGAAILEAEHAAYKDTSFSLTEKAVSERSVKLAIAAIARAEGGQL